MVSKIEERRQAKTLDTEEDKKKYRRLNYELKRITDEAYENWWKEEVWNYSRDKVEKIYYMLG